MHADSIDPVALAVAIEVEHEMGYVRPYKDREIEYIDRTPVQIELQIPLVEYFERIKRVKADKWQRHFCEYLQNAVLNRQVKPTLAEFHAQAQLGKTVILSQTFPAWCFGHDPLFRYVLAMYNMSRSEAHTEVVIQIMRSQLHREIFTDTAGHLPTVVSKSGFMTNARRDGETGNMDGQKSMSAVGLESGMTGSGFDWLTIDDPYKEPRDAWSETNYDNLARFWSYGVIPRMGNHSCVAAMFHRYNYDDFGGYLLNTGKFDYVRYASEADGPYLHEETGQQFDDPLGRAIGELICPERFGTSYYADKRLDNKVWLSMFQGRPGKDEGEFFKVDRIGIATEADWAMVEFKARGWDHAATSGGGDNSAGSHGGMTPDETCIFADVFSAQLDSAARVAKQKEIAEADGHDTTVVVPQGVGADGKDNVLLMQQNLKDFNVVPRSVTNAAPGSDAKKRRAYNLSVAVNSGKVKFLSDTDRPEERKWVERVKRLMRRFGNALSGDDEIDAMSDTYNHLYEEFHRGLVIPQFASAPLWNGPYFSEQFGSKLSKAWTVYAALKISPEIHSPNSAVIIARAPEVADMTDTLFILDEYKSYTNDYAGLFAWMDKTLIAKCVNPKTSTIWVHPDSADFLPTIRQKLNYPAIVFPDSKAAGIVESNWYVQHKKMISVGDLPHIKQEAQTWGFTDKGEPSGVGQVWDCVRMIAYQFRTLATPLTDDERIEKAMPEQYKIANMLKASPYKKGLTDAQEMSRAIMEQEIREKLKIEQHIPDWMEGRDALSPELPADGW